jgi:protein-S-isoprenylcysteine O-methyltransferase Ste14
LGVNTLNAKAVGGLLITLLVMAGLVFGAAGTVDYWEAWVFLGVFGASGLAITVYLMKKDPKLLARRVSGGPTAEKEATQKIIQTFTALGFIAMLIVPGLDHRWHWSVVPLDVVVAADILVVVGFVFVFFVYKENSFASATIELAPDQRVISSGPYALVRHPMYFGGLLMFLGMPVALGSWWGLPGLIVMMPALLWRLLDEEKFLVERLQGYSEYRNKVRYRLVPFLW